MTSPTQAGPGMAGPQHNVMGSPRVRGSPKMGPFSPGGTVLYWFHVFYISSVSLAQDPFTALTGRSSAGFVVPSQA